MSFPELNIQQANQLAALLSLDLTKPFWRDLQLHAVAPEPQDVRVPLRRLILAARQAHEADASVVRNVIADLIGELIGQGKEQQGTMLDGWTRLTYMGSHSDQPQLSAWEIVLVQCAYAGAPEMAKDLDSAMARWGSSYRDRLSSSDIEARVEALRPVPLSEWDFSMFARHGYSASTFSDPFERIVTMANVMAVFATWTELAGSWTAAQRQQLSVIGNEVLVRLGVWMPGPLMLPDTV